MGKVNLKKGSLLAAFALTTAGLGGCATGPKMQDIQVMSVDPGSCQNMRYFGQENLRTGEARFDRAIGEGTNQACYNEKLGEAQRMVEEARYNAAMTAFTRAWEVSTPEQRLTELNEFVIQWAGHNDPVLSTLFSNFAEQHNIDLRVIESDCVFAGNDRDLLCDAPKPNRPGNSR